ncbi:IPT/TIG domain-containing protein [Kitasatospora sp. NPDC036755]|uniref:IPT/TIG domain-containing protein n=1 Tax=Kitasatospora sp. NPDC036755 TaxID=3154600 RepID=UPI0033F6B5E4
MTAEPVDSMAALTMTLAAIAATGATSRPSGETLPEQRLRIAAGIARQLADPSLSTRGNWELAWLGLSPYNANMAYIAKNSFDPNVIAVVVRGTNANVTDVLEDLDVGTVVPFTTGGSSKPLSVSKGAMTAFTEIVSMIDAPPPTGTGLEQALAGLFTGASSQPALYVIGHSLGGCIATVLALHLRTRPWEGVTPQVGVVTFAAPTAGLKDFADHFDSVKWTVNAHYANDYDMVPRAWADLSAVKQWYPADHGPVATAAVKEILVPEIEALTGPNVYVQPNRRTEGLNAHYEHYDHDLVKHSTGDFLGQVAHQHANSTYLKLLRAHLLPAGPVVTALDPATGKEGTTVTITGSGFDANCAVDFGPVPCTAFHLESDKRIRATAPAGVGVVDVRITNTLDTSPAVPAGQFAYGGPQPVLVTGISPDNGKAGTTVTITGTGFAADPTVYFGKKESGSVTLDSPTQVTATAPPSGAPHSKVVDVRVLVNGYLSPSGPAGEFTYTG